MNRICLSLNILLSIYMHHATAMFHELGFETPTEEWNNKKSQKFNAELFNTDLIGNVHKIEQALITRYGFQKNHFNSDDGFTLECMERIVPDAQFTIICGAGFFPGNMTGCSSIIPMLPKKCNIIFYNNRGKGNSEYPWFYSLQKLWRYGINEYKDVIGALIHARTISNVPIMMHSYCSNALHTTKALEHLHKQKHLKDFAFAGLFLDSAVRYLPDAIDNIPDYTCSPWHTFTGFCARLTLWALRYTIFQYWTMPADDSVRINTDILAQAHIPTHHFYSKKGDLFTPYSMTHGLYEEHLTKAGHNMVSCTILPQSSHANHILKWKKVYREDLQVKICSYLDRFKKKQEVKS